MLSFRDWAHSGDMAVDSFMFNFPKEIKTQAHKSEHSLQGAAWSLQDSAFWVPKERVP